MHSLTRSEMKEKVLAMETVPAETINREATMMFPELRSTICKTEKPTRIRDG